MPLEQGLLTGKVGMDRTFKPDEFRGNTDWNPWFKIENRPRVLALLEGWSDLGVEEPVDVIVQVGYSLVNRHKLLSGSQSVRSRLGDAAFRLFEEAGDAHLVELVEIR